MSKLNFRVSSGLKDLIGQDLITDDYIGIFELVKNSYDAHATNVKIIFQNIKTENGKIIISDDGKGMNEEDIRDKWLFVAYSAKKDGSEEDSDDQKNYRDKIRIKRYYAGSKGIGRFSCDRLGEHLVLTTRKSKNENYHIIKIDWSNFEDDATTEFVKIKIDYLEESNSDNKFNKGTILEISKLRSNWDKHKLIELRGKLSRLITPSFAGDDDTNNFKITIVAPEFLEDDEKTKKNSAKNPKDQSRLVINGDIKNFIFETLKLKTTHIICKIYENQIDGESIISTSLIDRNNKIYEVIEKNRYEGLNNVSFHIFFLNHEAKNNFSRQMGINPVTYGNVFIYKNGFRINPYGDQDYDTLGLNRRKIQGTARYLGTRDLIGRIEINGNNPELKEKTSRDGGLIETATYDLFYECFYDKVIRRLEKYIVDVRNWGVDLDQETIRNLSDDDVKKRIVKLISNFSSEKDIKQIDYHPDIIKLIDNHQGESSLKIIRSFKKIAIDSNNHSQLVELEKLEKQNLSLKKGKEEAELEKDIYKEEYQKKEKENKKLKEEIGIEKEKNLYLLATPKDISEDTRGMIHHIQIYSNNINTAIDELLHYLNKKKYRDSILNDHIAEIKKASEKALQISKLITRSNFKTNVTKIKGDLVAFISEYISHSVNVLGKDLKYTIEKEMETYNYRISPIEISIIIDNLISNSKKAGAKKVQINFSKSDNQFCMIFSDDGKGVSDKLMKHIFQLGITDTDGSGIGLYFVRDILKDLNGTIEFSGNGQILKGASFKVFL